MNEHLRKCDDRCSEEGDSKGAIACSLLQARRARRAGLITFVNTGDPTLALTEEIIATLVHHGADVIELCVPFPHSYTDGAAVLRSHTRALGAGGSYLTALALVKRLRRTSGVPIVLLAEFSHCVKAVGIQTFLGMCRDSGVDGTLLHGLPPRAVDSYITHAMTTGIEPILGVYPTTTAEARRSICERGRGFLYCATQYGRAGGDSAAAPIDEYLRTLRKETTMPLAAGFGIHDRADVQRVFDSGMDAAIIGTAVVQQIEQNLSSSARMLAALADFTTSLRYEAASTSVNESPQ